MKHRLLVTTGLVGLGILAPSAVAVDPTVSAYGTSQIPVTPANPKGETSIRAALADAQGKALPAALAAAKVNAQALAAAANLNLGVVTAVAEQGPGLGTFYYGGPFGISGGTVVGPFNGKFCGVITRPIVKVVRGKRKVVGRRKTRQCSFPTFISSTVEVTFTATPKV